MRRLIIILLLFSHVLFINNLISTENLNTSTTIKNTQVVHIHYSMLLKIVYSNFLEILKNIVDIGYLIPLLPSNSQKNQNKQTNKNGVVIHFYNQFNSSTEGLKNIVNNCIVWLKFLAGKNDTEFLSIKILFLFYIWFIIFLFFYLKKTQFYFLKPRCSIEHILSFNRVILLGNLYLTGVNCKNPNWSPGVPGFQLGFFYFYKEHFKKEVK